MSTMEPASGPPMRSPWTAKLRRKVDYQCPVNGCHLTVAGRRGYAPRCPQHGRRMIEKGSSAA